MSAAPPPPRTRTRTRVVLVEDSATQARAIARVLESDGDIEVVAIAEDARQAVERVSRLRPDVAVMDLDIPGGGGALAIDRIMSAVPTPILVLSGLIGDAAAPAAVAALAAGAVEAMPKPIAWTSEQGATLRRMVRRVRRVPVIGRRRRFGPPADGGAQPRARSGAGGAGARATGGPVIGIAASTGGPAAVARVLAGLGDVYAPVLVVQHIHASFTDSFAKWLARASGRTVTMASDGDRLLSGCVYVSPGDCHLRLGPHRTVEVSHEPDSLHRPSADVLFESLAREAGRDAIGVILTGMGADGAQGLAALRAAGGRAYAQDEASSVVFGMPQAALRTGAVDALLPLAELAPAIRDAVREVVG